MKPISVLILATSLKGSVVPTLELKKLRLREPSMSFSPKMVSSDL